LRSTEKSKLSIFLRIRINSVPEMKTFSRVLGSKIFTQEDLTQTMNFGENDKKGEK